MSTDALNHADICFVVDTTGSMGPFIGEAKRRLLDAIETLGREQGIDLCFGLVEYRDHPPEDRTFVFRLTRLTSKRKKIASAIGRMQADGGGDLPEAVYDGVHVACVDLDWRPKSNRIILLVGDAPPHGPFAHFPQEARRRVPDQWANGCPCGLTLHSVTAAAEEQGVTIHSILMGGNAIARDAFSDLAVGTGGTAAQSTYTSETVDLMVARLRADFLHLELDQRVLAVCGGELDIAAMAETLQCPRVQVAAAVSRLGRRGFFENR